MKRLQSNGSVKNRFFIDYNMHVRGLERRRAYHLKAIADQHGCHAISKATTNGPITRPWRWHWLLDAVAHNGMLLQTFGLDRHGQQIRLMPQQSTPQTHSIQRDRCYTGSTPKPSKMNYVYSRRRQSKGMGHISECVYANMPGHSLLCDSMLNIHPHTAK